MKQVYLNLTGKPIKLKRSGVYLPSDGLFTASLKVEPEYEIDEKLCVFTGFVFYVENKGKEERVVSGEVSRFLKRMGGIIDEQLVVIVKDWKEKATLNRVISSDVLVTVPYPAYELENQIVAEFLIW